jgi:hypothetical protein
VSQINNKPIEPPYLVLQDFETFVKHQNQLRTDALTGVVRDKDKQADEDKEDVQEEQNYTYADLKVKFEELMDIAVY